MKNITTIINKLKKLISLIETDLTMKRGMIKRIERLEAKTEALRTESPERQEILLKLEQIEDKESIEATLLKLKLAFMSGITFADIIRRAAQAEHK